MLTKLTRDISTPLSRRRWLAAAAGLGLGLALIAFCDAWYSGSGFSGMQVIDAH